MLHDETMRHKPYKYSRRCRRCDTIYSTSSKRSKVCI